MKRRFALVPLFALACTTEPNSRRVHAWLYGAGAQRIEAPDTVKAGVSFAVTVYMYGSGVRACNEPDGISTTQAGQVTRIVSYMRVPTGEVTCTSDLRSYPQVANLRVTAAGVHNIWSIGATNSFDYPAVLDSAQRTIVVVP